MSDKFDDRMSFELGLLTTGDYCCSERILSIHTLDLGLPIGDLHPVYEKY